MIQEERAPTRPERVGVLQAVRRYPLMTILPMVLLAALGGALGYVRKPTYKATAQLVVGELNVSNPAAIGSVVQASESLASVYSRRINATSVRAEIGRTVGPEGESVTVSSTPVPDSPIVKVSAKANDEHTAVTVANAASRALENNARQLDDPAGGSSAVFDRFRTTSLKVTQQQTVVRRLKQNLARSGTSENQRALNTAQAELDTLKLQRDGLRTNYQSSQQTGRSTPALSSFAEATHGTSDRSSAVQVLVLLGLIAGAALGAALATFRLNRRVARMARP
jgi:hypothetical protein